MSQRANKWLAAATLLLLLAAGRAHAAPTTVQLEVIDVAGGRAYITPGEAAGLRIGQQAQFGRQSFSISGVSARSAVIDLQQRKLARGDKGRAEVSERAAQTTEQRRQPRQLDTFVGQWPKETKLADSQHPKPVPLGPVQDAGTTHALLSLLAGGSVPLAGRGSEWARGELRGRVTAEPFRALPLRLDLDAALQLWAASGQAFDNTKASRPIVRVRALELAYGQSAGLLAAAGRLRYAASTLGQLDGVRLQAPLLDGLRLAAFGGFVPDPLSGKPSSDSARFGGELTWEDLSAALRPRLSLVAQASRFDGALDERRLNAAADIFPGRSHIGAYAVGSLFDRDNAWNARPQELSAAGASAQTRFGDLQLNARFDMRRPERSRWLASFLPAGWFCTRRAASSGEPATDVCRGSDARFTGQADAGLYRPNVTLVGGVYVSRTRYVDSEQLAGFTNLSFLHVVEALHLDAGLFGQTGSLIRSAAVSVGAGTLLAAERLDLSINYRPAITRYYADTSAFLEHAANVTAVWQIDDSFRWNVSADVIAGRDLSVVLMQTALQWRPDARSTL